MGKFTCARIGYGIIAALHEKKLRERGVQTVAVVDTSPEKREQAMQEGFPVCNSCAEAAPLQPDFWDICVGNSQHLKVIQQVLAVDPHANMLVEKPVCPVSEIPRLRDMLTNFKGKIVVNENYASSQVTPLVRNIALEDLRIKPRRIICEMTKNRELDTARGRYVDYESGALRYEGPHILACVCALGEGYAPKTIVASEFEDAVLHLPKGIQPLFGQGIADIQSPGIHVVFGLRGEKITYALNDYLWGRCTIRQTAHEVTPNSGVSLPGPIYLIPSSMKAGDITQVLRDGYDARVLSKGFRNIIAELELDVLLMDTHPGLNEETLLSIAMCHALAILLRPDQQDYEGTGVTVQIARRLDVPRMMLIVNNVPASFDAAEVKAQVEQAYACQVGAVLPHCEDLMVLASSGIFALRYPDHPITARLKEVVTRLVV